MLCLLRLLRLLRLLHGLSWILLKALQRPLDLTLLHAEKFNFRLHLEHFLLIPTPESIQKRQKVTLKADVLTVLTLHVA